MTTADASQMTDIELTRLCVKAMGMTLDDSPYNGGGQGNTGFDMLGRAVIDWHNNVTFDPLHDDAQCFALVKRFRIAIGNDDDAWYATPDYPHEEAESHDLNRAIVECVARMQAQKQEG